MPFKKNAEIDTIFPTSPPIIFPINDTNPPTNIAKNTFFLEPRYPNIPARTGTIKAPEYTASAINKVGKIYFIFKAIKIDKTPKITIKILVIFIALLSFKSFIKICAARDDDVKSVVSAEEDRKSVV